MQSESCHSLCCLSCCCFHRNNRGSLNNNYWGSVWHDTSDFDVSDTSRLPSLGFSSSSLYRAVHKYFMYIEDLTQVYCLLLLLPCYIKHPTGDYISLSDKHKKRTWHTITDYAVTLQLPCESLWETNATDALRGHRKISDAEQQPKKVWRTCLSELVSRDKQTRASKEWLTCLLHRSSLYRVLQSLSWSSVLQNPVFRWSATVAWVRLTRFLCYFGCPSNFVRGLPCPRDSWVCFLFFI